MAHSDSRFVKNSLSFFGAVLSQHVVLATAGAMTLRICLQDLPLRAGPHWKFGWVLTQSSQVHVGGYLLPRWVSGGKDPPYQHLGGSYPKQADRTEGQVPLLQLRRPWPLLPQDVMSRDAPVFKARLSWTWVPGWTQHEYLKTGLYVALKFLGASCVRKGLSALTYIQRSWRLRVLSETDVRLGCSLKLFLLATSGDRKSTLQWWTDTVPGGWWALSTSTKAATI